MVLLVFRVPEAPAVGPGRCVCRWAAARPLAVRASGGSSASISHVIPLGLFQVLNRDRCYFNVSGRC